MNQIAGSITILAATICLHAVPEQLQHNSDKELYIIVAFCVGILGLVFLFGGWLNSWIKSKS